MNQILLAAFLFLSITSISAEVINPQENKGVNQGDSVIELSQEEAEKKDAQPIAANEELKPEIKAIDPSPFINELDLIRDQLHAQKYTQGIQDLRDLIKHIKHQQSQVIDSFFPEKVETFQKVKVDKQQHNPFDDTGLLLGSSPKFETKYENHENNSIDINLIYSKNDPTIKEYLNLIKSHTGDHDEQITFIKIQNKFDTLEKQSPDANFIEWNIVISKDILINVISNGIKDARIPKQLLDQINFTNLELYLLK